MRDIKPKKQPSDKSFQNETKKLYEKDAKVEQPLPAPKPVKKPTSQKESPVPVSKLHIPRQQAPKRTLLPANTSKGKPFGDIVSKPATTVPKPIVIPDTKEPLPPVDTKPFSRTPVNGTKVPKKKIQPARPAAPKSHLGLRERKIAIVFILLLLAMTGVAAFLFLPKATVKLTLQTAPLLVDQDITLANASQASEGSVPATSFEKEVKVEGTSPTLTTEVIGTKAKGTVRLVNRTTTEQQIKEQSRLTSQNGTLYFMQKYAIIPANGTSSVEVEAAEPGTEGNLESGRLNFAALDSSAQSVVYAEVVSPISGGSGESVKVIKEQDIAAASDAAGQAARQKVEEEIRSQLKEGWTILEESWNAEEQDFQTTAEVGQRQDSIPYTASYIVRVMGYEDQVLQQKVQQALEGRLDADYMLFPGPISFTKSVESIDWQKQTATLTVRVTHTTVPSFSLATLREKLTGRGKEEAENYLRGLKGVQSVDIQLWPFWVQTIPYIDGRIIIDLIPDKRP